MGADEILRERRVAFLDRELATRRLLPSLSLLGTLTAGWMHALAESVAGGEIA